MTAEYIAYLAGILISLIFSFTPKLKTWYYAKSDDGKRVVMLAALLIVSVAAFGLSCAQIDFGSKYQVACTKQGATDLAELFIQAALANQVAYKLTPKKLTIK